MVGGWGTRWGERKRPPRASQADERECFSSKACAKVQRPEGTWGNGVWGMGGHAGVEAGGRRVEQNLVWEKQ